MAKAEPAKQLPASTKTEPTTKTQALSLVNQTEKELQEITSANFYEVPARNGGKRMEPDSRALQHYANKFGGIATKIIDSGMDEKKAWGHIQGWPKNDPLMVMEDKVTIMYEFEFQAFLWDYIKSGCPRHKNVGCPLLKDANNRLVFEGGAGGIPVLSDPLCQLELRRLLNRKIKFAERECITKAKSRIYKLIMNMEWRDVEEIDNESAEVASISDNRPLPLPSTATVPGTQFFSTPAKEAPKPPQQPTQQAPAAATTKPKEDPKPTNPLVPRAHIPSEAEMAAQAAATPAQQGTLPGTQAPAAAATSVEPKKNSERLAIMASAIDCSPTNILTYMASALQCPTQQDLAAKPKPEIRAVITGLEHCVTKFPKTVMAAFIKKEPMDQAQADAVGNFFVSVFAAEMKKTAEAN